MGFSADSDMVRVDFFKKSGKWYTTEAVKWTGPYHGTDEHGKITLIHDAFLESLRDHLVQSGGRTRLAGLRAVCLEPYHEYAHPICVDIPEEGL
jgi:hypothetical protein